MNKEEARKILAGQWLATGLGRPRGWVAVHARHRDRRKSQLLPMTMAYPQERKIKVMNLESLS